MMVDIDDLIALTPAPGGVPDWDRIWPLWPELPVLDTCPQDPIHHAEGDVGTHTRMVVEALVADADWQGLTNRDRQVLFWAAVLHDIGKPACTVHQNDGRISSRGHSRIGTNMARVMLWHARAPFDWREDLCGLIAAHQMPFWAIERDDPRRMAIETSWWCRTDLLCLHAKADALGRICEDQAGILDNVALAQELFAENACLGQPFAFANDESRVAFFEREDRDPHYAAHEDPRCEVTVMVGPAGVGKDTWIAKNLPNHPVVSLDDIRADLGAPSTGNQGVVIQEAQERAREHLRARQDFVWNATNVSRRLRQKVTGLARRYDARVHLVYLEPAPDRLFRQNASRPDAVPEKALEDMMAKLDPPLEWEGHQITRVVDDEIT